MELKRRFSSALVFIQSDPARQFVVEMDASYIGVGTVLSQRAADDKLNPYAFFPKKLSPAERNYDVGNREICTGGVETLVGRDRIAFHGMD